MTVVKSVDDDDDIGDQLQNHRCNQHSGNAQLPCILTAQSASAANSTTYWNAAPLDEILAQ